MQGALIFHLTEFTSPHYRVIHRCSKLHYTTLEVVSIRCSHLHRQFDRGRHVI